jgi:hypothetical protein
MPEIMPFGKHVGKSVEQIALQDYAYFVWVLNEVDIRSSRLRERFGFVEHVANNFVSSVGCKRDGCAKPAEYISIYANPYGRCSSTGFVYCSDDCWKNAATGAEPNKISLHPLGFRAAISSVKSDTDRLVQVIAECMGLRPSQKTKVYLEDFFNNCQLRVPYVP